MGSWFGVWVGVCVSRVVVGIAEQFDSRCVGAYVPASVHACVR